MFGFIGGGILAFLRAGPLVTKYIYLARVGKYAERQAMQELAGQAR
jgi:hypothetical protein